MSTPSRFRAFLSELRRRRVGRVAVGYAVAAWLVVEVADTILPRLLLPDWTVSAVIVIAMAGFPVAVVLAWWFDVVPTTPAPARKRWLMPALLSLVVLLAAAFVSARLLPRLMDPDAGVESIVVLPFDDPAGDATAAFLATGVHQEVVAELAQVSSLRVISPRSARHYKQSALPIPSIARELSVDAVVEGTVRRHDASVEVRVALIRPFPTERQIWTQTFRRPTDELPALHEDVARGIAEQLHQGELTRDADRRLGDADPVDPRAYELYLRGMYEIHNRTGREAIERGLGYLHQAVEVDPADARTYAALANGYATLGHTWVHYPDAWARARAAADRALQLDPDLADAHHALGKVQLYHEWDWAGAGASFRKAIALNPSLAAAHYEYGFLRWLTEGLAPATASLETAAELDPLFAPFVGWLGSLYGSAGRYDDALRQAREAIDIAEGSPVGWVVLGQVYSNTGRHDDAIEAHRRLVELNPRASWMLARTYVAAGRIDDGKRIIAELERGTPSPFDAYGLGLVYFALGDLDRAFHWLNYGEPHAWLPWIAVDESFLAIRADPRAQALLARLGLEDARVAPHSPS